MSYSIWTQGIFGEQTTNNVDRLDKIPSDPLTYKEYTYSITKTKQEYQLAGMIEGSEISFFSPLPLGEGLGVRANAAEQIATAIVTGNYNGALLKTENGLSCKILSIPSIISTEGSEKTDLEEILEGKNLVYNGYNNLPSNYKGSKYKTTDGFEFQISPEKLVVYSDSQECKPLYAEDPTERIRLIKNLQTAYSGTIIQNTDKIKSFIDIDVENTDAVTLLSTTVVNNNLGGKLSTINTTSNTCDDTTKPIDNGHITYTIGIPTTTNQAYLQDVSNCGYTCELGYEYNVGDNACMLSECTGSIPTNATSNATIQSYGVTWSYNTIGGECTFKCNNLLGYTYQNSQCIFISPTCAVGYTYNTIRDKCEITPVCASGYTFNTTRDKCEVVPICSTGYTYNTSTKLCQKIETVNASSSIVKGVRYCYNTHCGSTFSTSIYTYYSDMLSNRFGQVTFDINGNITYGNMRTSTKGGTTKYENKTSTQILAPGQTRTFTVSYNYTNTTVTNYTCSSGYTLSGTICSRTLTATPTCSSGGVLNTTINLCQLNAICSASGVLNLSINKCQLEAICDNGVLNTSLDACVEN